LFSLGGGRSLDGWGARRTRRMGCEKGRGKRGAGSTTLTTPNKVRPRILGYETRGNQRKVLFLLVTKKGGGRRFGSNRSKPPHAVIEKRDLGNTRTRRGETSDMGKLRAVSLRKRERGIRDQLGLLRRAQDYLNFCRTYTFLTGKENHKPISSMWGRSKEKTFGEI